MNRRWQYATVFSALLFAAAPSRAQDVHLQMEQVHDLAKQMFGLPVDYAVPYNPCPDPCPCANKCPGGTTCDNLGGTVNKKIIGRVWYWGWTLRNLPANSPTRACARQYVLDHLNLQQQYGHYTLTTDGGEVLTISHGQIYLAAMSAAYLFALTNVPTYGAGNNPDTQMLNAVKQWWADEKYVWDLVSNGSGQVRAPGARFFSPGPPNEGEWTYREQVYALIDGRVPMGLPSTWSTDKYTTGGWIIDELKHRNYSPSNIVTPPAGYAVSARVPETLCIYRRGSDYLHYMPQMRNVLNPLFWVRKEGTPPATTYPPIPNGTTFQGQPTQKPANFPGAVLVPPGGLPGLVAGSAPCPAPDALQ